MGKTALYALIRGLAWQVQHKHRTRLNWCNMNTDSHTFMCHRHEQQQQRLNQQPYHQRKSKHKRRRYIIMYVVRWTLKMNKISMGHSSVQTVRRRREFLILITTYILQFACMYDAPGHSCSPWEEVSRVTASKADRWAFLAFCWWPDDNKWCINELRNKVFSEENEKPFLINMK